MTYWNLKPSLGKSLALAIRSIAGRHLPSNKLAQVTTDLLTIDQSGTLRLEAVVEYGQWVNVPHIPETRKAQKWTLWAERLVIHSISFYANSLVSDVKLDIGQIRGTINLRAIKQSVVNWIHQQTGFVKCFLASKGVAHNKAIISLYNKTNGPIFYQLCWAVGQDWTGWKRQKLESEQSSWHSYVGAHACRVRFNYVVSGEAQEQVYELASNMIPDNKAGSLSDGEPYCIEWSGNILNLYKSHNIAT